jgi:site-specific DNA-methyltransferase (adenine-specific)
MILYAFDRVNVGVLTPHWPIGEHRKMPYHVVLPGDMREVLQALEPNSVDVIVTDPPYEIGMMGKKWDRTGVAYDPRTWEACYRVLKPGGYMAAFGASRTYHRMACVVEDARFLLRDCLMWVYFQGFPKSKDISKALDDSVGAKRKVKGGYTGHCAYIQRGLECQCGTTDADGRATRGTKHSPPTGPVTDLAKFYDGYGTALKPAYEPIVLAMKPLEGTFAKNVVKHGTGGMNINACRVGASKRVPASPRRAAQNATYGDLINADGSTRGFDANVGNWPPNVLLGDFAPGVLDAMAGSRKSGSRKAGTYGGRGFQGSGEWEMPEVVGGEWQPSSIFPHFYYAPKATQKERDEGLKGRVPPSTTAKVTNRAEGSAGLNNPRAGTRRKGVIYNDHPTVKPVSVMHWLVKLLSPPGEDVVVLDPFTGSGTTGVACVQAGVSFIGVEMDPRYLLLAEARIDHALGR